MTRKTKLSFSECNAELTLFADAARDQYDSHSFAAGYFQSMLADALATMPKAAQQRLIDQIRTSRILQPK